MQQSEETNTGTNTELPVESQFGKNCTIDQHAEYEEKKEKRQLKHWVIKACVAFLLFMVGIFILTLCYTMIFHQREANETLITSMINAFVDIIKFMSM